MVFFNSPPPHPKKKVLKRNILMCVFDMEVFCFKQICVLIGRASSFPNFSSINATQCDLIKGPSKFKFLILAVKINA